MNSSGTEKKNWQLTKTAFDSLLAALSDDVAEAGERYNALCGNLTRFFETRGLPEPDDAADEVLDRLARKLEGGETFDNVQSYALGIARILALELYRRPRTVDSDLMPEISVQPNDEENSGDDVRSDCLDDCLNDLSPEKREIIIGYYEGEKRTKIENRAALAERLGIPPNALRNRAVRIRNALEACIKGCIRRSEGGKK